MLYPLKMKPFLKFYPYGGRRFAEVLEIDVPRGVDIAETWEISDHGAEQSVVLNGPHAGSTLRQMMMQFKGELVGEEIWAKYGDYFPLLVKFLDCDKRLPAHMHPNDEHAKRLGLADKGKTEAWYIVRADAGAAGYCGALPGLTPDLFRAAIARGDNYDGVMKKIPTRTGDTYFVPPGRLHGLDAGNLAFEIQQNSDAGFGWDWGHFVEAGVIPAEDAAKHPELAIECAYYEDGPQEQTPPIEVPQFDGIHRTFLAACQFFVLEKWRIPIKMPWQDAQPRFNTFTLINGAATFSSGVETVFARRGESLLIPANCALTITPNSLSNAGEVEILRCYVPDLMRDVIGHLRERGFSDESIAWLGSYGRGNDLLPLLGMAQDALDISGDERHQAALEHRDSRDETS